jgi:hypothetical protein
MTIKTNDSSPNAAPAKEITTELKGEVLRDVKVQAAIASLQRTVPKEREFESSHPAVDGQKQEMPEFIAAERNVIDALSSALSLHGITGAPASDEVVNYKKTGDEKLIPNMAALTFQEAVLGDALHPQKSTPVTPHIVPADNTSGMKRPSGSKNGL